MIKLSRMKVVGIFVVGVLAWTVADAARDPYAHLQWGLEKSCQAQTIEVDHRTNYILPVPADRPAQFVNKPTLPIKLKRKIRVAVLDTGVNKRHPELLGKLATNAPECKALSKLYACMGCDEDPAKECRPIQRKKIKECEKIWLNLENPEVDMDRNGYPLDCMGWSTLDGPNEAGILGRPYFDDEMGHGTHVASVITAESDNGIGIRGCSDNVEIIPIKVLRSAPNQPVKPLSYSLSPVEPKDPAQRRPTKNLGDMVARGIIYAIHAKADVINISMGWPQSHDSQFLRQAIAEAQKRGIIVVAAAGNDSTTAALHPCSYPGVICVASHDPDGSISHFSNFGPAVDIAAPGLNILGAWPSTLRPARFREFASQEFTEGNYEYLHGTSQATPFVSCAVAELLSRNVPREEIYPRLLLGARPHQAPVKFVVSMPHDDLPTNQCKATEPRRELYKKFTLSGNLDINNSLSVNPQPLILPTAKERIRVEWNRRSGTLEVPFELKNFWRKNESIRLTAQVAKPHRDAVRPVVSHFNYGGPVWAQNETRKVKALLQINDTPNPRDSRLPSEFDLEITVEAHGFAKRSFYVSVDVVTPAVQTKSGDGLLQTLKILTPRSPGTDLRPIDQVFDGRWGQMDFLLINENKPTTAVATKESKVPVWSVALLAQDPHLSPLTAPYRAVGETQIELPDFKKALDSSLETIYSSALKNLSRLDTNFDGLSDYVVSVVQVRRVRSKIKAQVDYLERSPTRFFIFDQNLNLLRQFDYTSNLVGLPDQVNLQLQWMRLGDIKVPVWVGEGQDPSKKPDLFVARKNRHRDTEYLFHEKPLLRFYYLNESGQPQALNEYEGFSFIDMLTPSQKQMDEGRIPVLLAKARGSKLKKSYIADFGYAEIIDGKVENFRELPLFEEGQEYNNLLRTRTDAVYSLMGQELFAGTYWFSSDKRFQNRISLLINEGFRFFDYYAEALRDQVDAALWTRFSYMGQKGPSAFVLTNSEIQFHEMATDQVVATSLNKYTFLGDNLTTNIQFPFVVPQQKSSDGSSDALLPTLFTTEGSGLSRGIRFIVPSYNKNGELIELITPARLRLEAVDNCVPIDQPFWGGPGQPTYLDYDCRDQILRFPLSY